MSPAATAIVNGTSLATGSGIGSNYIYTRSSQPPAAIRNFVLWAKTGNAPNGLFWPDSANSRWESITPILISRLYPPATNTNIPAGVTNLAGLSYDNICATIGTAVFASAPMVTVMLEYDDLFPTAYLSWGVTPLTSTFSIACSNPDYWDGVSAWVNSARNIQFRLSAVGIIWIPFV